MPTESRILLQGGTLLIHDQDNHVVPTVADLLIEGSLIAKIENDIQADSDTKVVNVQGKIISPGFIDTHRHLYQTQFKGKHGNHTLVEYFPSGNFSSALYKPEDLFWGELAGAMESIDAGTTTVVDVSSCNVNAEYPPIAVQALLTSGLRSVYCFVPPRKIHSWSPWKAEDDYFSDATRASYQQLAKSAPYGNGRVTVGFGCDNIYMPAPMLQAYFADLRDPSKGKAHIITNHGIAGPMFGNPPTAVQLLAKLDLLGPDILISHSNFASEHDAELYKTSGAHISSTPSTELQMGWPPVALEENLYDHSSLGIDCHSWTSASLPIQMNLLLQHARCKRQQTFAESAKWSRYTGLTAERVFNLGTIGGAKAIGLESEIGKIKVGMKADLVIVDTESPSMFGAALEDPVAAIVLHSGPRDVEMVIADGIIRKEGGKLMDVTAEAAPNGAKSAHNPGAVISWADVKANVTESRKGIKDRISGIDMEKGELYVMDMFHMHKDGLVETLEG